MFNLIFKILFTFLSKKKVSNSIMSNVNNIITTALK